MHQITLEELISSRGEYPASLRAKQEQDEARKMTVGSGRKLLRLYELCDPHGYYLKTCAASLLLTTEWYSRSCYLNWKIADMKSNRLLFQLAPSMRPTAGIESGLLLTPSVMMSEEHPEQFKKRNGYKNGTTWPSLASQVKHLMLPTPNARDTRGKSIKRDRMPDIIEGHNLSHGMRTGLRLQPSFVLWMMGFPIDWCDFPTEQKSANSDGEMKASRLLETQ